VDSSDDLSRWCTVFWIGFVFFGVERETRVCDPSDGAFLEFIPPPSSLRSQAFSGEHSHDEDALVFVSALDLCLLDCLLALIAPCSDVPLPVTME
jgi:hypothetical protein